MLLPIQSEHPEPRKVKRAVDALEAGEVIGYPTDTVYGLGCDLFNKKAIDRLYQIKEMDRSHQLAFICPDLGDIARYAIVENAQYRILKRLLPGPYCFILEATREVPRLVQSKRKTVGIRIPQHEVILEVVRALGRPVMSTTANAPGEDAFVDPREISDRFPGLSMVLDAGGGGTVPTTVVDLTSGSPVVVREGAGPIDVLLERVVSLRGTCVAPPPWRSASWTEPRRTRCGLECRRRSRRESRRSSVSRPRIPERRSPRARRRSSV